MPWARRSIVGLVLAWLLAGGFLVYASGRPPVSRTQEARVLETAREMAERPVADWAVPRLNGAVRLRKPPMAYWMSATSFRVLGVGDVQGRLPMTLLAWLTLGVTFAVARRLFDPLVAALAAAVLLTSWLFFKSSLLAETDGPTAAFLALGVYAFLRAADSGPRDGLWQHALAACYAGAILCKGPPAVYLLLLTIGLCAARRQWQPLKRFVTTGAVLTLIVLAVPWFAYVAWHSTEEHQLGRDLLNSAEGGDHHAPPWYYVQLLLQATLPWTAVWAAALAAAGIRFVAAVRAKTTNVDPGGTAFGIATLYAREPGLVTIATWGLAVVVPLCFWGNKQLQYLLPAMPPTAVLVAWALAAFVRRTTQAWLTAAVIATAAVLVVLNAASLLALLAVRSRTGSPFTAGDGLLATAAFGLAVWTLIQWRHGRPGGVAATVVLAAVTLFVALAWVPRATGGVGRDAAFELAREYPGGRFVFRNSELPVMSWAMRRAVPLLDEPALAAAAADPRTVVIEQQQDDEHEPTPPAGYVRHQTIRQRENVLHVFVPEMLMNTTRPSESFSR